ncbi:aspartate/glutamate racemase family protein [Lacticaseibacillus thailandensis]|uniref:aspartate/glutamate racemase family protein n=1 Tax=Lacticaseibacillus thailandensis TaxID=381741 RepID=UPI0006CFF272|nr:aspartate/glutamate racemase family protein [Lacticaseibacillus thailandensis]
MKTIGLLGGMSWESTVTYYQLINTLVNKRLGGVHSAKILIASVDFDEIARCQERNEWDKSADILGRAAHGLELAGADFILIGANTMHKVATQIQSYIKIPLLHIADATIAALQQQHITRVGLLGTKYTVQEDFYKQRIAAASIEVLTPNAAGIDEVNRIIYEELVVGQKEPSSKAKMLATIEQLQQAGAQGLILGCTELDLLVQPADTELPLFDTTRIHAEAAVDWALR